MSSKRKAEEVNSSHAKRVKTKCRIEGCTNGAVKGGVCKRHGAKVERKKYTCSHEGCTNGVQKGGVCKRHGAKVKVKICSHERCTNYVQKGGVCWTHGAKVKVKPCSHEGCTNRVQKGGVCWTHGAKVKVKRCSHEGCTNCVQRGGVCIRHGANNETNTVSDTSGDEYSPSSDECDVEAGGEEIGQEENDVGAEYENGSSEPEEGNTKEFQNESNKRRKLGHSKSVVHRTARVQDSGDAASIAPGPKQVAAIPGKGNGGLPTVGLYGGNSSSTQSNLANTCNAVNFDFGGGDDDWPIQGNNIGLDRGVLNVENQSNDHQGIGGQDNDESGAAEEDCNITRMRNTDTAADAEDEMNEFVVEEALQPAVVDLTNDTLEESNSDFKHKKRPSALAVIHRIVQVKQEKVEEIADAKVCRANVASFLMFLTMLSLAVWLCFMRYNPVHHRGISSPDEVPSWKSEPPPLLGESSSCPIKNDYVCSTINDTEEADIRSEGGIEEAASVSFGIVLPYETALLDATQVNEKEEGPTETEAHLKDMVEEEDQYARFGATPSVTHTLVEFAFGDGDNDAKTRHSRLDTKSGKGKLCSMQCKTMNGLLREAMITGGQLEHERLAKYNIQNPSPAAASLLSSLIDGANGEEGDLLTHNVMPGDESNSTPVHSNIHDKEDQDIMEDDISMDYVDGEKKKKASVPTLSELRAQKMKDNETVGSKKRVSHLIDDLQRTKREKIEALEQVAKLKELLAQHKGVINNTPLVVWLLVFFILLVLAWLLNTRMLTASNNTASNIWSLFGVVNIYNNSQQPQQKQGARPPQPQTVEDQSVEETEGQRKRPEKNERLQQDSLWRELAANLAIEAVQKAKEMEKRREDKKRLKDMAKGNNEEKTLSDEIKDLARNNVTDNVEDQDEKITELHLKQYNMIKAGVPDGAILSTLKAEEISEKVANEIIAKLKSIKERRDDAVNKEEYGVEMQDSVQNRV